MTGYCFIDNFHIFKLCKINPENAIPVFENKSLFVLYCQFAIRMA